MKVLDQAEGNGWVLYCGDSTEVLRGLPDSSVGFTVYSPPFAQLYVYSPTDRDLGNSRDYDQFFEHYRFILAELLRVTKPGRNMSVHCFDIPMMKMRDGEIGLIDFPGDICRSCRDIGWIFHSRVTIQKCPVRQVTRTKALGLLHKQLMKDSAMSRQGLADYVLTFRKPGVNPEPVQHNDAATDPLTVRDVGTLGQDSERKRAIEVWQWWANPVWQEKANPIWTDIDESDTLNVAEAREEEDERHLCALQLPVIRRCVTMWSNPGDVVLSPFTGIGSEGYVAVSLGRKFVGVELKQAYWKQAVRNLKEAEPSAAGKQISMFGT